MSDENTSTPAGNPENDSVPEKPAPTLSYKYGEGDMVFIHANAGKYIAIVEKAFPGLRVAEAEYEGSFQTITKKGPLYDKEAPHYLCYLNNPAETTVAASETDMALKSKATS